MNSKPTPKPSRAVLLFGGALLLGMVILGCGKKDAAVPGDAPAKVVDTKATEPNGAEGQATKETPSVAGGGRNRHSGK